MSTSLSANIAELPPRRWPIYYGWICVVIAALAMTATLPGRTHGLGLITEPLLTDLQLDRTLYARINLACTLLGAACCLPIGWMVDRYGVRILLTTVLLSLGLSVLLMGSARDTLTLFSGLLGVRALGQGALSVVSLLIVGKWFRRRLGIAMGTYAVLLTFGFIASILLMGAAIEEAGWRTAWNAMGLVLLGFTPLAWMLTRDAPEASGLITDGDSVAREVTVAAASATPNVPEFTLKEALRSPAFWIFAAGAAAFNVAWSGITLFNESILAEQGFDAGIAVQLMAILTGSGLIANLIAGKLATRGRVGSLLGIGLLILALALAAFPGITTIGQLRCYGLALGITGGIVTVVFFAAWGQLFGQSSLGRIQSVAQMVTIFGSASGPVLLAECQARTGSYSGMFYCLSTATAIVAIAAFWSPLPQPRVQ